MSVPLRSVDEQRQRALSHPLGGDLLAIVGAAGTGKTTLLLERASLAARTSTGGVLLTTATRRGAARLRELSSLGAPHRVQTLERLACEILDEQAAAEGTVRPEIIDEVRAATLFHRVGAELFSLDWTELPGIEIDPEIAGLRTPEFFADAAFRLIRKLRAALVSPAEFQKLSLQGANKFYGKPPNFADPGLLMRTDDKDRASLHVSREELERQRGREIDLIKVLFRLYSSYVDSLVARGCMTEIDAVYEATRLLASDARVASRTRTRLPYVAVDDAQDLSTGQIALLKAIYGEKLAGVSVAGDPALLTRRFAGARGEQLLTSIEATVELVEQHRCPAGVIRAAAIARKAPSLERFADDGSVELYRAAAPHEEAAYVADKVASLLREGHDPSRIAVITRNLRSAHPFVGALLARNVPLDVAGEANVYDFPATADALGVLWAFYDPYRHDWLLRNLESPWLRLSDASIATLCSEPADPQELLFEIPSEEGEELERRVDRRRNVRLARNVTRGDVDSELSSEALTRLSVFREALLRWERLERDLTLPSLARTILEETVLAALSDDARGRFARGCVERLLREIETFAQRTPLATLGDFLEAAEESAAAEGDLLSIEPVTGGCVMLLDVEEAKGREYDHVFVIDVRAGAFPRYYSPDTFLFTPQLGMIPKENVGDARVQRTAKFVYASDRLRFRERYIQQERSAFAYAATRARERLYVSASGRASKGIKAPEILEELKGAG